MRGSIYNPRDWIPFGTAIGLLMVYPFCQPLHFALVGRTTPATVTRITRAVNPVEGTSSIRVEYHFTDPGHRTRCNPHPVSRERTESTTLAQDDPMPTIGDTINIDYVPDETGASHLFRPHEDHDQLMLILAITLFTAGTLWIYRTNKEKRNWNADGSRADPTL